MRITIETEEPSPGPKTVEVSAPGQTNGGAAPMSAVLSQARPAPDDRMHLNAGRAPTFASLANAASARHREVAQPHHGGTVTDAGPAPQVVQDAARTADASPATSDKGKVTSKRK